MTVSKKMSYARARALAREGATEERRNLARRTDMVPEILYYLAEDPDPVVRREIALNESAPRKADYLLSEDRDEQVREELAGKISRLAPGLTAREQDQLRNLTYRTLERLARDQLARVRGVLAEALKDVADAPPEVIRRLAFDTEISVSRPVLESSPVLTDEDLKEIIEANPAEGARGAISRRTPVRPAVADAILATEETAAVSALLANENAQIREEALDQLIDTASGCEVWHEGLVHRPELNGPAARKLAVFVADHLLQVLQAREDLPADVLENVGREMHRRLEGRKVEAGDVEKARVEARAAEWGSAGYGVEDVMSAVEAEDMARVGGGLAHLSDLTAETVAGVLKKGDPEALVSLAFKSGLSPAQAEDLQSRAGVCDERILSAQADNWPLSQRKMDWILALMAEQTETEAE